MGDQELFTKNIVAITDAYGLVGKLELTLRRVIPETLSSEVVKDLDAPWYSKLILTDRGKISLHRALVNAPKCPEKFLPFSFWRDLLSKKNYGSLWLPGLFKAFPNLESPKRMSTFLAIDQSMSVALQLRNNLAHYNFSNLRNLSTSQDSAKEILNFMVE